MSLSRVPRRPRSRAFSQDPWRVDPLEPRTLFNVAPVNHVPGPQEIPFGAAVLVFSSAGGNGISVADADATIRNVEEVTLDAGPGVRSMTLASRTGITVEVSSASEIIMHGTLANLNRALDGLRLDFDPAFAGDTSLTITTNDQDLDDPQSDSDTVAVRVLPPPPPVLSIGNARLVEGDAGTTLMQFTVSAGYPGAPRLPFSVHFATTDGTAVAGSRGDYFAVSGDLQFTPGDAERIVDVPVLGDVSIEPDETFFVDLSSPSGAVIGSGRGTGTIVNDDQAKLSVDNVQVVEGNSGTTDAVFTVTRTGEGPALGPISVEYRTADGTAVAADRDYVSTSGVLQLNPDETSKTVTVPVNGDLAVERDETFFLDLLSASGASIAAGRGTGTIVNDDLPHLSVGDVTVTEDTAQQPFNQPYFVDGVVDAVFPVTLADAAPAPVTVRYATADATATAAGANLVTNGSFEDGNVGWDGQGAVTSFSEAADGGTALLLIPASSPLAFGQPSGTIRQEVSAPSTGLYVLRFALHGPAGSTAFVKTELNAIRVGDYDAGPAGRVATAPGDAWQYKTFLVNLFAGQNLLQFSAVNDSPNDIVAIDDISLRPLGDYVPTSGVLTFAAGQTTQTISVPVIGDHISEPVQSFVLNLSDVSGAVLDRGQATGTIVDDEPAPFVGAGSPEDRVAEGDSGSATPASFGVSLSNPSDTPVTVQYTLGGTATAGADYTAPALTGTITFAPGETMQSVPFSVLGDRLNEADETVTLTLSNPSGATIPTGETPAVVTIVDDDPLPVVSIADATPIAEGDAGTTPMTFLVTLSASSGRPVTVSYTTVDGTADSGLDYQLTSGTLTFVPGQTSQTIMVLVNGDTTVESNERFTVNLSAPVNATLGTGQATGLIQNDDAIDTRAPRVSQVFVGGSAWTAAFKNGLQNAGLGSATYGFAVTAPGQLDVLPWANLNQVAITFNEPVTVKQADLSVRGSVVPAYAVSSFRYDAASRTAVWTLGRSFVNDRVLFDLDADGGGVSDLVGLSLDGEWTNGNGSYPSGNGIPGGDFQFRLNALPGDVNRDGRVNAVDLVQLRSREGSRVGVTGGGGGAASGYAAAGDINGDGVINAVDVALWRRFFHRTLPAISPASALVTTLAGRLPVAADV